MTKNEDWLWDFSLTDEVAFRKLFEHYYANLCVYAKRYIQDLNTREDLVQDVFCSLWLNRKKIDYSVPVTNYLVTSIKNQCLNRIREVNKQELSETVELEKLPLYVDDNEHLYLLHELEELFNRTLANIPEDYRIAFQMSHMENKSTTEIAETLGVSVRTVERYRNKAIKILKNELKDYLPIFAILYGIKF